MDQCVPFAQLDPSHPSLPQFPGGQKTLAVLEFPWVRSDPWALFDPSDPWPPWTPLRPSDLAAPWVPLTLSDLWLQLDRASPWVHFVPQPWREPQVPQALSHLGVLWPPSGLSTPMSVPLHRLRPSVPWRPWVQSPFPAVQLRQRVRGRILLVDRHFLWVLGPDIQGQHTYTTLAEANTRATFPLCRIRIINPNRCTLVRRIDRVCDRRRGIPDSTSRSVDIAGQNRRRPRRRDHVNTSKPENLRGWNGR